MDDRSNNSSNNNNREVTRLKEHVRWKQGSASSAWCCPQIGYSPLEVASGTAGPQQICSHDNALLHSQQGSLPQSPAGQLLSRVMVLDKSPSKTHCCNVSIRSQGFKDKATQGRVLARRARAEDGGHSVCSVQSFAKCGSMLCGHP